MPNLRAPVQAASPSTARSSTPTSIRSLQVGNVVLAGLDSTAPRQQPSPTADCIVHQLRRCAEQAFAAVPEDKTRIVVAHHHFAPGHDRVFDVAMPGARRAIDCFVEQKVEMILGGHLHRSYIGNSLDFFPGTSPRARGHHRPVWNHHFQPRYRTGTRREHLQPDRSQAHEHTRCDPLPVFRGGPASSRP